SPFSLRPGEILPIVKDYHLLPDVTLELGATRILGIARQGDTTTLVIYSNPTLYSNAGDAAYMRFRVPAEGVKILRGVNGLDFDPNDKRNVILSSEYPTDEPLEYLFSVGKQRIRILAMGGSLADRTWFVEQGGKQYVIWGPEYLADYDLQAPKPHLIAEAVHHADYSGMTTYRALVYSDAETPHVFQGASKETPEAEAGPPQLSPWWMRRGDAEAQTRYFTGGWKSSDTPQPMGSDGDTGAYAWYRSFLYAPKAGNYALTFTDAGDWLDVFINGEVAGNSKIKPRGSNPVQQMVNVTLQAGQNTLAVLAAHYGRPKLFNYLGPLDTVDAKGINGPVLFSRSISGSVAVEKWRTVPDDRPKHDLPDVLPPDVHTALMNGDTPPENGDVFKGRIGFAWVAADLPAVPGPSRRLHFENVDDNATVYLNGKKLAHHEGWSKPFDVTLNAAWREGGPNEVVVLVENTSGPGGIMGDVTLLTAPAGDAKEVRAWKMRGGLGDPQGELRQWQPVKDDKPWGAPAFYRAEFSAPPPGALGQHPILRVALRGMSRGSVWLNGHNLGRYPEKVPVDGIWLPECWLSTGKNTLIVFDEEGKSPSQVNLYVEERASRFTLEMNAIAGQ
ncbi:MAG TPA: hypothetical protein VKU00_25060, partial [Chthonomonadaceae bacterium]|nr:hypothetical protein [Chthonomonadaceae bacterium]